MAVPVGIILIWSGANAAIPTGYTRETSLDGKFPKSTAGGVDPNVTGGAATHTHTSPAHTHTMINHTHTYTLSSAGQGSTLLPSKAGGADVFSNSHTHPSATSGPVVDGSVVDAITYAAASNEPPYNEVIFIKSDGSRAIPNNVIGLWNSATVATGWVFCDGSSSTPDLRNKYLKGAAAASDAGGSGGGYTNTHDISHSHTATNHSHSNSTSANSATVDLSQGAGVVSNAVNKDHTHQVSFNNTSCAPTDFSGSLVTTETVEPLYKKLLAIQNQVGTYSKPVGIIGMWLGTLANIPRGWHLCDGDKGTPNLLDYHFKVANTTGQIGDTGGSNTHTHAAQSHSHSNGSSHTHTGNVSNHVAGQGERAEHTAECTDWRFIAQHSVINISSTAPSYNSANTTADSSNNEPPFRTVAFVQFLRDEFYGCIL